MPGPEVLQSSHTGPEDHVPDAHLLLGVGTAASSPVQESPGSVGLESVVEKLSLLKVES